MRRIATANEFFDILDKMGNGKFVTIGYVTGANLDVPTVSRKNPQTNRMKKYADYSVFGEDDEIGALVKITSYNFQYLNRESINKKYGEYKTAANDVRTKYGLDPIADRASYKKGTSWSPNGPSLYSGENSELSSHSYNSQNVYNARISGVVYAVGKDGHIIRDLSPEEVKPYLKKRREVDGVAALRKMGAEETAIQSYIEDINNLKFKYMNFESNSILWITTTIDKEPIVYINENMARAVDDININSADFIKIAKERYQSDLHESVNRGNKYRLTESQLHNIIKESVKGVLKEDWAADFNSAMDKKDYLQAKQQYDSQSWFKRILTMIKGNKPVDRNAEATLQQLLDKYVASFNKEHNIGTRKDYADGSSFHSSMKYDSTDGYPVLTATHDGPSQGVAQSRKKYNQDGSEEEWGIKYPYSEMGYTMHDVPEYANDDAKRRYSDFKRNGEEIRRVIQNRNNNNNNNRQR